MSPAPGHARLHTRAQWSVEQSHILTDRWKGVLEVSQISFGHLFHIKTKIKKNISLTFLCDFIFVCDTTVIAQARSARHLNMYMCVYVDISLWFKVIINYASVTRFIIVRAGPNSASTAWWCQVLSDTHIYIWYVRI